MSSRETAKEEVKRLEELETEFTQKNNYRKAVERVRKVRAISKSYGHKFVRIAPPSSGAWRLAAPVSDEYEEGRSTR